MFAPARMTASARALLLASVALLATAILLPAAAGAAVPVAFDDGPLRQTQRIPNPVPTAQGWGAAVSVDGTTAASFNYAEGALYVYSRSGGTWTQTQRIVLPCGPQAGFNLSDCDIDIDGDVMAVGNGVTNPVTHGTGTAYVLTRSGGAWSVQAVLDPPGLAVGDMFGSSLAVSGDTVAVSAPGQDGAAGVIRVYALGSGLWSQQATLTVAPVLNEQLAHRNLEFEGDTLVAGANKYPGGPSIVGSAYVWTRSGSNWGEPFRLTAADGSVMGDNFGSCVALSGDTIAVGAATEKHGGIAKGSIYLYERSGLQWVQRQEIEGPFRDSCYGGWMTLEGDTLVNRHFNPKNASLDIWRNVRGTWMLGGRLRSPDVVNSDYLGEDLVLSGDTLIAGAYGDEGPGTITNNGAMYFFETHGHGVDEDGSIVVGPDRGLLRNDSDADNDPLSISWVDTSNLHGSLVTAEDGGFTYTPDANWNGTATATYRAVDSDGVSNVATLSIDVYAIDDYPVGTRDTIVTPPNTAVTFNVLDNDTDVETPHALLQAIPFYAPKYGTYVTAINGLVTYTPPAGFVGIDEFRYHAYDGALHSDSTSVTVIVDNAPLAAADTFATDEDTAITGVVLVNDSDADGHALTASVVDSSAVHGTLVLDADGSFDYTPDRDWNGTATFTYRANDGLTWSDPVAATITVDPVNDAPVAVDDALGCDEDARVTGNVLANDTDVDTAHESLEVTGCSTPAHGTLEVSPSGEITYTPFSQYYGTDSFSYCAYDGTAWSEPATVTITVRPVNDYPWAYDDRVTTTRNRSVVIDLTANDTDVDTPLESLLATSFVGVEHGTIERVSSSSVRFTPAPGFTGFTGFVYRVFDGDMYSDPATVLITVEDGNAAPVLAAVRPQLAATAVGTEAHPGSGVTVASVLGSSVTDDDGDPVGMAVYGVKLRSGIWQYSLDGGSTWAPVSTASSAEALLLAPDDRIRFLSFFNNGTTSISYRAWDGTSGSAGGRAAVTETGGTTAFSAAADTALLDVDLPWASKVGRLYGPDRYGTSVATARYATYDWTDVTDIVLVSGADANASDPLAAAGLIWAYHGAPMIQTSPRYLPDTVRSALLQIADDNRTVRLHIVGGTTALPEARVTEIEAVLRSRGVAVTHDRLAGENRYQTAAMIAAKMVELRGEEMSGDVLIAHGAERERFFDALALSPISATKGSPILLTPANALAGETLASLRTLEHDRVIVAGGTAVVSANAFNQIPTQNKVRWSGANRFDTAVQISNRAIAEGMLSARTITLCAARADAASLPDALASAAVSQSDASPLMLTETDTTPQVTATWLSANKAKIRHLWLIGGPRVITSAQETRLGNLVR